MFLDRHVGDLIEPLTGRKWDRQMIWREYGRGVAYFQSHNLGPGDRVFVHYGNTIEFFVDLLAVWTLGGCVIPIDPRLTPFEVGNLARLAVPRFSVWLGEPDASTAAVLSAMNIGTLAAPSAGLSRASMPAPSSAPNLLSLDQPALILFTSGTTGEPKGVVHTHRTLRARWFSLWQVLGTEKFRRSLCLLPTHFGHGLICNCLFPWLSGQDLFIMPPFRADLLTQLGVILDQHEITFVSSVPSMWRLVLKTAKPPALGRLRRVVCGSAPLSGSLWKDIRGWTGTQEVLNVYGITEVGSWIAGTTMEDFTPADGLIGVPWGAAVKILQTASTQDWLGEASECSAGEQGHVWLHTPGLMAGYLDREDLTRQVVAQGWFRTGDVGVVDDRGLLYLRGREREEINKGGMKIHPGEIDGVAEQFEHTLDVCAFGYDDPLQGEDVAMAVVLKAPADEHICGLYNFLSRHLAKYKMPGRWYLLEAIPRTSRGKVNRSKVAQTCAALKPMDHRRIVHERS